MIPARRTEPTVGASVCASGSHVWNGHIGTLIANPRNTPMNATSWKPCENPPPLANRCNSRMSNVCNPAAPTCEEKYIPRKPSSMNTLPNRV